MSPPGGGGGRNQPLILCAITEYTCTAKTEPYGVCPMICSYKYLFLHLLLQARNKNRW